VIACVGLTLIAVATGTLLFSVYGFGVFVVSPFIIGAVTAYFANFHADIGGKRTAQVLAGAMALAGIGLVLFSLEGLVCIVLLAPLAFGIAMIGASFGRAIAVSARRPRTHTVSAVALLPVVFALEALLPAQTSFDSHQTIDIDAPPQAVWNSILHMDRIDEPLTLLLRLGIAHPLRGEIFGEGVGAMRHGEFSTGTAIERVTEWAPNQKLAFAVLNDIPAMRELSPYQHVHAPHVIGFFRTSDTSFELEQLGGNRTRIVERTSHQLRLEPVLYWLPMARWVVHENNARVLRHIKRLSEVRYQRSEIGDQISTSE
jgi:hypothetical protein